MTTYLGALSHGDERLALHRDGDLIHWEAAWRGSSTGPPRRAHDAIEQWITSVTDDWTEQAELRRRALDIRYRIDHQEGSSHENSSAKWYNGGTNQNDPPESYLAVRLDGGSSRDRSSAVNQSTQAPPIERNMAEDLATLDQAHRERMDACECPSCIPPRIGDLLPDVLAEMRRREGR